MSLTKPARSSQTHVAITAVNIKPPEMKSAAREGDKPEFFVRIVTETHKEEKVKCTAAMYLLSINGSTKTGRGKRKAVKGLDMEIGKMFVLHKNTETGMVESIDMFPHDSFMHNITPEDSEAEEFLTADIDENGNVIVKSKPLKVRTPRIIRFLKDLAACASLERDQTVGKFIIDDIKGRTVFFVPGDDTEADIADPFGGAVNLASVASGS